MDREFVLHDGTVECVDDSWGSCYDPWVRAR